MKTIENIVVTLLVDNQGAQVPLKKTYMDLVFIACNREEFEGKGFVYEDMKQIDRIEELKDKSEKKRKVDIEDADFAFIKNRVETMRWGIRSKEITKFIEHIKSIK